MDVDERKLSDKDCTFLNRPYVPSNVKFTDLITVWPQHVSFAYHSCACIAICLEIY
jgi:hypothetical protein